MYFARGARFGGRAGPRRRGSILIDRTGGNQREGFGNPGEASDPAWSP